MTPYGAVATIFAISGASFGTWASRIPTFKNQLDLEPAQLGTILSVLALASIVSFSSSWTSYGPIWSRTGQ